MELEQIGKYKIIGKIGRGAMGEVYRAHDPVLNREVAIKMISANLDADDDLRKRFQREAQAAARLNHPNIITVFDYGEEHGKIYMAMELLEGADLRDLIREGMLPTLGDKMDVMEQMLDRLSFAHGRDIVHRDLKPSNIHVQPNGQVKILDFGLARLGESEMTKTGTVMGTPNYMSPEQVLGEKVDVRADVFSCGAVFYEILTNRKPFDGDSAHAVLFQVVNKQPDPVRQWSPDVPAILVDIVEKAMDKKRDQRFGGAAQMREALGLARKAITGGRVETTLEGELATIPPDQRANLESYKSPAAKSWPPKGAKPAATLTGDETRVESEETAAAPRPARVPGSKPPARAPGSKPPARAPGSKPPMRPVRPAPSASRAPLLIGGAVAVLVAGAGAFLFLRPQQAPPPPASTQPPDASSAQMAALTENLVKTQLAFASRELQDKNFKAAITQAEGIIKIAPGNAQAKEIIQEARAQLDAVDASAKEAKASLEAGNIQKASEALSKVLALDPNHPVAVELSARLNKNFKSKADEAQKQMAQSRTQAEQSRGASSDAIAKATAKAREADGLMAKGEYTQAARGYLEARDAFDRARHAAETRSAPAPSVPAAEASAAPPAPVAPSAVPTTTLPAGPTVVRKTLTPAQTILESGKTKKGPAGFDDDTVVVNKDFMCKLGFEPTPALLGAKDAYTVKFFLQNDGDKAIRIKDVLLITSVNGSKSTKALTPPAKEAPARNQMGLGEIGGVWEEATNSWYLELVVTSRDNDICRNRLTWK